MLIQHRQKICNVMNRLIPLFLAFFVGAIFAVIIGYNPFEVYGLIIKGGFGSFSNWMMTLGFACPIIMTGIATAFSFKAGVWNIGIEGQLYIGAYAAALVGGGYYGIASLGLPAYIHIPLALLAGALCATVFAMIPALLKALLNVNVVVSTMMLNYIAIGLTNFMCKAFHQGNQSYDSTYPVMDTAIIPKIDPRFRVTWAIILAIVIVLVIAFILKRTKFGYEINAIGRQLEFSEATGMRVKKKIILLFLVSGVIAGLAGASEVLGVNKNFTPGFSGDPGLGWEGYFVAVLAENNPIAVLIIAIIFGGFRFGSISAQSKIGMPLDLLNIIKSTMILFYAVRYMKPDAKIFHLFGSDNGRMLKGRGK